MHALSAFDLVAILIVVTAVLGFLNAKVLKLPHTIGLLVMGLAASLVLVGVEIAFPDIPLTRGITDLVRQIDFQDTVLKGMLGFLLFAGALHVDVSALRSRAWAIGVMATVGVVISTAIVGVLSWQLAKLVGVSLPLPWALAFGALISPTDPVAVLSTLKTVKVSKDLEMDMTGESLFNDGAGIVVFGLLVAFASGSVEGTGAWQAIEMFLTEAVGGAALGLVAGWLSYRAMKAIDNYPVETLVTLALVMGTYALAQRLHASGPIAMVVAGLLIGNKAPKDAMSDLTQVYVFGFWTLIDEILNSLLFLLIGLEVLVLRIDPSFAWFAMLAVPITLLARYASVGLPVLALRRRVAFTKGTVTILTWGGLRGGISVALALSLPEVAEKSLILAATYTVVVFTIVAQGLSLRGAVLAFAPHGKGEAEDLNEGKHSPAKGVQTPEMASGIAGEPAVTTA